MAIVSLTEKAIAHVKSLRERQGELESGLRVAVQGGGCSGFSYKLNLEPIPGEKDKILEFDGLKVYVDPKSALYLSGIEIDYSDDLMDAGFKFQNPNAKKTCGCGTSFSA